MNFTIKIHLIIKIIGIVVFKDEVEKVKVLTDDAQRQMKTDGNRSPGLHI